MVVNWQLLKDNIYLFLKFYWQFVDKGCLAISSFLIILKFVAAKKNQMTGKSRKFIQKLTKEYRLAITDKQNFKEVYATSVSRLKFGMFNVLIFILSAIIVVALVFYTPLRQLVPGYPSNDLRKIMYYNSMMVDSLQQEIVIRDSYLEKIQQLIKGEIIEDTTSESSDNFEEIGMLPMHDDSIFDNLIGPDKYKFSYLSSDEDVTEMTRLNLFTPVKGVVVNKFDASPGHFGTDIVGQENSYISSVLDVICSLYNL